MNKKRLWIAGFALAVLLAAAYWFVSPWVVLAQLKADAQARREDKMAAYIDFASLQTSLKAQVHYKLESRLRQAVGGEGRAGGDDALQKLGMALLNPLVDVAVQDIASPKGIVAIFNGENPIGVLSGLEKAAQELVSPDAFQTLKKNWKKGLKNLLLAPPAPIRQGAAPGSALQSTPAQALQQSETQSGQVRQQTQQKRQWRLSYTSPNQVLIKPVPEDENAPHIVMRRQGLWRWKITDIQLGDLW